MAIETIMLLVILIYFVVFKLIDNKQKKQELNQSLKHEKSWIDYKKTLPKNTP